MLDCRDYAADTTRFWTLLYHPALVPLISSKPILTDATMGRSTPHHVWHSCPDLRGYGEKPPLPASSTKPSTFSNIEARMHVVLRYFHHVVRSTGAKMMVWLPKSSTTTMQKWQIFQGQWDLGIWDFPQLGTVRTRKPSFSMSTAVTVSVSRSENLTNASKLRIFSIVQSRDCQHGTGCWRSQGTHR